MIHVRTTPWTTDGFIVGMPERKHTKWSDLKEIKMEHVEKVKLNLGDGLYSKEKEIIEKFSWYIFNDTFLYVFFLLKNIQDIHLCGTYHKNKIDHN